MDSNHHLIPSWLSPFLKATYFVSCQQHCESSSAKRECNLYCLLCKGDSLCSCCMVEHKNHPTVQIRRSSYSNVVRLKEISQYIDASNIQAYRINNERVIFLKERPILRPGKAGGPGKCSGTTCEICKRNLLDTSIYCSLGCKVKISDYY
ncbi:hypothetical protein IFM89_031814 [Coptis chinensis]|uniref:PLATZ transcription factor family protein n=1 Tax=Coptis chinensis TaxID=261450 RepID=A0A835HRE3_9MAGN|nr:hypothetical protein IFM89_031814 [Coptis chinensis]